MSWLPPVVLMGVCIVLLAITYPLSSRCNSDFSFSVGDREIHEVRFWRSQFSGRVRISVDGLVKIRLTRVFEWHTSKTYDLVVGDREHHKVSIVKTRPKLAPAYRKQICRVQIDGRLIGEY
jgi:hypothetical protein